MLTAIKNNILWHTHSAVSIYRLSYKCQQGNGLMKVIAQLLCRLNVTLNGCDISQAAKIGKNLELYHPVGVVIGVCVIGDNAKIYQNVTIGQRHQGQHTNDDGYPVLEDDVVIYAGAVVAGAIKIGRGARVGANSVVLKDVPPYTTVAGIPAKALT